MDRAAWKNALKNRYEGLPCRSAQVRKAFEAARRPSLPPMAVSMDAVPSAPRRTSNLEAAKHLAWPPSSEARPAGSMISGILPAAFM